MRVRKTELAEKDLLAIYRFGFQQFGEVQADHYVNELFDVFELLAFSPLIERERFEYSRPVRIHPFRSHVIAYEIDGDALVIIRVLSRFQNLKDYL